jgi:hypothetical protein
MGYQAIDYSLLNHNTMYFFFQRTFLVLVLCVLAHFRVGAQGALPKREVGVSFSGLNFSQSASFSAFHKKQVRDRVFRRVTAGAALFQLSRFPDVASFSLAVSASVGREKRRELGEKLVGYRGPQLSLGLSLFGSEDSDVGYELLPRLGYVFGLQHQINAYWALNVEVVPYLRFNLQYLDSRVLILDGGFSNMASIGVLRCF